MVCKANTRCILVRAERLYFQYSLLLVLLCIEVLVIGGYKLVERGIALRSMCLGVFECVLSTLPLCGVIPLSFCRGSLPLLL
jgi:hypothetical protein